MLALRVFWLPLIIGQLPAELYTHVSKEPELKLRPTYAPYSISSWLWVGRPWTRRDSSPSNSALIL